MSRDELDATTVESMVQTVGPDWRVRSRERVETGRHRLRRLTVATPEPRDCVLKVSVDGEPAVALEARLLRAVHERTDIPVPDVDGAVDEHAELDAPFFLAEWLPGRTVRRTEIGTLDDATLAAAARDCGRHLAALHGLDAVSSFGRLGPAGPVLRGDRPPAEFSAVAVTDSYGSWPDCARAWADEALAMAPERFADCREAARGALSGIEDVPPADPALAHIDCAPENLLFDDGGVAALLDFEFTLAAAPAYDLAHVEVSLRGWPWTLRPSVPERPTLVREALLAGYRERGDPRVLDRLESHGDLYELLCCLRWTAFHDRWLRERGHGDVVGEVAAALRDRVAALTGRR